MPAEVVLDTSAVLAWLRGEPEADAVLAIFRKAKRSGSNLHIAFITIMEIDYILIRRLGEDAALRGLSELEEWPVSIDESTPEWRHAAARIKAHGGLSLADSWIAALALRLDAELVHKDREFDSVAGLRSIRI